MADSFVYKRTNWGAGTPPAGLTWDEFGDGSVMWIYHGSYFSFPQGSGQVMNGASHYYLNAAGTLATAATAAYKGPQYKIGADTYVHYRFDYNDAVTGTLAQSMVLTAPLADLGAMSELTFESNTAEVLNRMNFAYNGGVVAHSGGNTPNKASVELAGQIFADRASAGCTSASIYPGSVCPYPTADPMLACRKRVAILITDGGSSPVSQNATTAARNLYCQGCVDPVACRNSVAPDYADKDPGENCDESTSNPIEVVAVGIELANAELNAVGDWGDNGKPDGSRGGYVANNEGQLTTIIRNVISGTISGDFVTSAAGVGSMAGGSGGAGDMALVPSLEYPGWRGHLKAWDLSQDPPVVVWDAADKLAALSSAYSRRILTAHPNVQPTGAAAKGYPLELLDAAGNWAGANAETDFRTIWKAAYSAVPDGDLASGNDTDGNGTEDMLDFVRWLYDNGGAGWLLHPIIRSQPAIVGPPNSYGVTDHASFAGAHSSRQTLIYVTSNGGMIHAFRAGDDLAGGGVEEFAFIPPGVLDAAYALFKAGKVQEDNPSAFKWILGGSPRVADHYTGSQWTTQMMVTYGPYNKGLIVLDVTNPVSGCTTSPCSTINKNYAWAVFDIVDDAGTQKYATATSQSSMSSGFGEGWSTPAMYWTVAGSAAECKASSGSGYGAPTAVDKYASATAGHQYTYYSAANWSAAPTQSAHTPPAGLQVDYAVLADTVAVIDETPLRPVIATYQADLAGRIRRYDQGATTTVSSIMDAGTSSPLYYNPAALHLGSNQVVLAFNSGAVDEDDPPVPDITAHLYMRTETGGTVDATTYFLDCTVGSFASCTATGGALDTSGLAAKDSDGDGTDDLAELNAISSAAKPIGPPLLLMNDPGTGQRVEVFWLLFDPVTSGSGCGASGGTSYLLRMSVDSGGTGFKAEEASSVDGRAGGMSLAGGGTKVVLSKSGTSTESAKPDTVGKGAVAPGGTFGATPPNVESWREVR